MNIKKFFGFEDENFTLVNEPTIDYNNTIQTLSSTKNNDILEKELENDKKYTNLFYSNNDINYKSNQVESEEEITTGINTLLNTFSKKKTNFSEKKNNLILNDIDNNRNFKSSNINHFNDYKNNYHNKNGSLDHHINFKSNKLTNLKKNLFEFKKKKNDKDINQKSFVEKLKKQNEFLTYLNDLFDLNSSKEYISPNVIKNYDSLRECYLNELKRSEILYNAYFKLILKYRELKNKNISFNDPLKRVSKYHVRIKEKIQSVKRTVTNDLLIDICTELLDEIEKLEHNDIYVDKLQNDLNSANLKIIELENKLKTINPIK